MKPVARITLCKAGTRLRGHGREGGKAGKLFPLMLFLFLSASLFSPVWSIATESPMEIVRKTSTRMLGVLKDEREIIEQDPTRLYDLVVDIVLPYFDFERMSRWTLGKHWRRASPEQRERFVEEFRTLLVRTYGSALADYADEKIVYLPMQMKKGDAKVVVRTEIQQPGNLPIPINYSMYEKDSEWKVYDVSIDGISLVANYRTIFSSDIRQGGLDKLIEKLASDNEKLLTTIQESG